MLQTSSSHGNCTISNDEQSKERGMHVCVFIQMLQLNLSGVVDYSGTSDKGPSEIGATSLKEIQLLAL